jgi:hypothetical protein
MWKEYRRSAREMYCSRSLGATASTGVDEYVTTSK